jgi:hypothetical protein
MDAERAHSLAAIGLVMIVVGRDAGVISYSPNRT